MIGKKTQNDKLLESKEAIYTASTKTFVLRSTSRNTAVEEYKLEKLL